MVADTWLLTHGFCTSSLCKKTLLHKVCPHVKQHVDKPPISNHEEAARNHEDTWLSNHVEGATLWRGRPRWDAPQPSPYRPRSPPPPPPPTTSSVTVPTTDTEDDVWKSCSRPALVLKSTDLRKISRNNFFTWFVA